MFVGNINYLTGKSNEEYYFTSINLVANAPFFFIILNIHNEDGVVISSPYFARSFQDILKLQDEGSILLIYFILPAHIYKNRTWKFKRVKSISIASLPNSETGAFPLKIYLQDNCELLIYDEACGFIHPESDLYKNMKFESCIKLKIE